MAIGVVIIGESGTGKSTSIRNLNPETTAIVQAVNKPLPFKHGKEYKTEKGNKYVTKNYQNIIKYINLIDTNEKYKKINTIIIDDATYLITDNYMTTKTGGYDKFNEIANYFYNLLTTIESLKREDLIVYLIGHEEAKKSGKIAFKTIGNMIDEKITIEGLFTIVLNTVVNSDGYFFGTQNNGNNTSKSPMGMFDTLLVPNDLKIVNEAIREYFGIGLETKNNKEEKGE